MKKYCSVVFALTIALTTLTSCIKDNEQTDYSDFYECAITAFSLQDIVMTKTTESSKGKDSSYTVTIAASKYKFTIDQKNHTIYNTDSLPLGTDISRCLTTVSANGVVTYVKDSLIYTQNSSDSIDFTKIKTFRIYSYNSQAYQDYSIKINVCQSDNDALTWTKVSSEFPGKDFTSHKTVELNGQIVVLGTQAGSTFATSSYDGTNWTSLTEIVGANHHSATVFNNRLFVLKGKKLYASLDGVQFTAVAPSLEFDQLLCASSKEITAISGNKFLSSNDGEIWNSEENKEVNIDEIPLNGTSICFPLRTNSNIEKMLYIGVPKAGDNDSCAVTWCKISSDSWFAYPTNDNKYPCPLLSNLSVIRYGKSLYAFGNDGTDKGSYVAAFSKVYCSVDEGITWKETSNFSFPDEIKNNPAPFSTIVKSNGEIYIILSTSGTVWRGVINNIKKNYTK